MFPVYRNQSIELLCKLIDWFLYEATLTVNGLRYQSLLWTWWSFHHKFFSNKGSYFASHFIMAGEKFDNMNPERFLFGENADLNYLTNKPRNVRSILFDKCYSNILIFLQLLFLFESVTFFFPIIFTVICQCISWSYSHFFHKFLGSLLISLTANICWSWNLLYNHA